MLKNHPIYSPLFGQQGMHICHLNVRSILNKIDEIKKLLSNKNIQIMTISESWLLPSINNSEISIEGYNIIRQDRNQQKTKNNRKKYKRSGGIISYIRNDIIIETEKWKHLNSNDCNLEAQWFTCKLPCLSDMIICNMYRPPNGNKTSFINYVIELINVLKNVNKKEVYMLGDVNIDLNCKDIYTKMLLDSMKLCKLMQKITENTRICKIKKSLLDHIYTNSQKIIAQGTGPVNISDHMLV